MQKFFPLKLGKNAFHFPYTFCRLKFLYECRGAGCQRVGGWGFVGGRGLRQLPDTDGDANGYGTGYGLGNGLTTFTFNKDFK